MINKVLVIDDTAVVRAKLREMLPPGKFEVLEAKDGLEGYNLITQEKIQLIMLDFILPKMSGWEVFQKIQASPELKKIPLVIMSGRKEEVTEKIPEPFEKFEFLNKPFDQRQLITAINLANKKASQKGHPEPAKAATTTAKTENAPVASSTDSSAAEIQALNAKVAKMQKEIDTLKKQLAQIVTFIKQKIK